MRTSFYLDEPSAREHSQDAVTCLDGIFHRVTLEDCAFKITSGGLTLVVNTFTDKVPRIIENIKVVGVSIECTGRDDAPEMGLYRRGSAFAYVDSYIGKDYAKQWKIELTVKTLKAANRLYNDIRSHTISPNVAYTFSSFR